LFRREITRAQARAAEAAMAADAARGIYLTSPVSAADYRRARQLAKRHTAALGTRSLDVLHVACALALRTEAFYTFDLRQAQLAQAAGLSVPGIP
jgi:predicted nucleic acid-binding protein